MKDSFAARARTHTLGDLPRRAAARFPHKTAIIHGDVRITFSELDQLINATAAGLHGSGLQKGDRLALISRNCWQYPVIHYATARLGVILVPVNFTLTAGEIAYILQDCCASAVIAEADLVQTAAAAIAGLPDAPRVTSAIGAGTELPPQWSHFDSWLTAEPGHVPGVPVADDDVLRIMYTSGTESRPKGALLTSRSLMWQYMSCIEAGDMTSEDVELHAMPLYHCAQLDNFLNTDIYLGATSVITNRTDPESILRLLEQEQITNFFAPPTVWISLLRCPGLDSTPLSALSKGYYGASPLPPHTLDEIRQRIPGIRLWNFYGQTEMASIATVLRPEQQMFRPGSAGKPALNVESRIVDEDGAVVAAGAVGEIVHRSPHATVGYLNNAAATEEAFRDGWFHSGDLGYFDEEGYLWVVDRKKDMIKTGGENVSSREVEEVFYQHESVKEAAAFAVPHPRWVEAVAVAVVPRDGAVVNPSALQTHCRDRLAGFKVPKLIVGVEALPKNPSGKVMKRELRHRFAESLSSPPGPDVVETPTT
jgi:fatty-acyl-CoA synthase